MNSGPAHETFSNVPKRPEIQPRVISTEDQPEKPENYQLMSHENSSAHDSFYDDLEGIEDMVEYNVIEKPKDKYEKFKKFHKAADPLEAFCKAKGINYTKCTPREYYKGEGSKTIIFSPFLYYRAVWRILEKVSEKMNNSERKQMKKRQRKIYTNIKKANQFGKRRKSKDSFICN